MAQSSRVAINAAFMKLMMLTLLGLYFIVLNSVGGKYCLDSLEERSLMKDHQKQQLEKLPQLNQHLSESASTETQGWKS